MNTKDGATTYRVALIEDHEIMALGVKHIFQDVSGIIYEGSFGTVAELEEAYLKSEVPQVVILDLRLADGSNPGDNVLRLREHKIGVVIYTSGEDLFLIRHACAAGVLGVVRKSESTEALVHAVKAATQGDITPSPDWASAIVSDAQFVSCELTTSEQDVLSLYATGETSYSVARNLGYSTNTVNSYIRRIREKYQSAGRDAGSRVELYKRAVEDGIVPAPIRDWN